MGITLPNMPVSVAIWIVLYVVLLVSVKWVSLIPWVKGRHRWSPGFVLAAVEGTLK